MGGHGDPPLQDFMKFGDGRARGPAPTGFYKIWRWAGTGTCPYRIL